MRFKIVYQHGFCFGFRGFSVPFQEHPEISIDFQDGFR